MKLLADLNRLCCFSSRSCHSSFFFSEQGTDRQQPAKQAGKQKMIFLPKQTRARKGELEERDLLLHVSAHTVQLKI